MERLPPEAFDNIGSFYDFALDEIKIWPAGRPRRNVSSVNKIFAANFYDRILRQKLACMQMCSVPINVKDIESYNRKIDEITFAELYKVHAVWYQRYKKLYGPKVRETIEAGKNIDPNLSLIHISEPTRPY